MIRKIFFIIAAGLWWINNGQAQSGFTVMGGFNNSIFYCSQTKSQYMHRFTAENAYLVSFSYRENLSALQKNLQVGAQLEFKQQSAEFYYEDIFSQDTVYTRVKYNIRSVNLYLFPELKVGETVKFVFSGGPVFQYIVNVEANGRQAIEAQPNNIESDIHDKNSKEISGFNVGAKLNLGIEIPLYKNSLYLIFCNSYYAGFTGMKGNLSKRMKFFNCVDINISGGLVYVFHHKDWFDKK